MLDVYHVLEPIITIVYFLEKKIRVAASRFINASFNEYQYLIQHTFYTFVDGIVSSI